MSTPPPDAADRSRVGALYEAYAAAMYTGLGWIVRKAGGSTNAPDFGADLLVYHPEKPDGAPLFAVQCKFWSGRLGVETVQAVYTAKNYYGAEAAVILANQPLTDPARILAEKVGVQVYLADAERWEPPAGLSAPVVIGPLADAARAADPTITQDVAAAIGARELRRYLKIPEKWRVVSETLSVQNVWRVRVQWTRKQTYFTAGQIWEGTVDIDAATGTADVVEGNSYYIPERRS